MKAIKVFIVPHVMQILESCVPLECLHGPTDTLRFLEENVYCAKLLKFQGLYMREVRINCADKYRNQYYNKNLKYSLILVSR